MKRRMRTQVATAVLAAGCTVLAACSSSGGGSGAGSTDGGSPAAQEKKATGSPVTIGYLIPDSGPEANPQVAPGLKAGLDYINNHGGINGRPVKALECHTDASAAKETSCANNFVQQKVVAVLDGFDRGIADSLPVYKAAKIPVLGNVAQNAVADTDTSGTYYSLGPANAVYAIAPLVAFKKLGKTKIAYGLNDVPAQHTYADKFLVPVAKQLGIKMNAIYYSDTSPNFSVVAATAQSSGAQVLGVVKLTTPSQCQQFINSSRQAGFQGTLLAGNCVGVEQLGANSKDVYTYQNNFFPAMSKYLPAKLQKDVKVMDEATKGIDSDKKGFFTYEDFATMMDFVRITSKLKTIDKTTVMAALKGLKDYQGFAGPTLTCGGTVFPGTSACSNKLILSVSNGDGTLKPTGTDEGGFTAVDPSLVPK